ncbi:hypothetical protein DFH09DRAFT_1125673 [Mycena vulgaris]|nr:hypothetical protein DFH09DRAFT_1125673 [Mycena vulgaris]
MILRALYISGDTSFTAFLVICKAEHWFLDPKLDPIMQRSEVWSQLGRIVLQFQLVNDGERSRIADLYFQMGRSLVNTHGGKSLISQVLPGWINVFVGVWGWNQNYYEARENFSFVIGTVWVPELDKQHDFSDKEEESRALAIAALSKVWGSFEHPDHHEFIRLARCTVSTYQHFWYNEDSIFREVCSQLAEALVEAWGAPGT